jgi:hypothetical protein
LYLRTDESEEAVSALEMVADRLAVVEEDIYQWKWAIIALHNAAQGFMVLALRGTNSFHVLGKKAAKAWTEAVAAGEVPPPGDRLETYLNLYSRTKGQRMMMYVNSRKFQPHDTQDDSIRDLNALRNDFVHFLPKGWSLEVSGLPAMFEDVLAYVDFLGWDSGNVVWIDEDLETRAKAALDTARHEAASIERAYASSS